MALAIPTGQNVDAYQSGRGLALYKLRKPQVPEPPMGTPAWWSNQGINDVWMGIPSRTGSEVTFVDGQGNPLPVIFGNGAQPPAGGGAPNTGTYPPPNPAAVQMPPWVKTDYWNAYIWALEDPGTAALRQAQGSVWSVNYQRGLADGLQRRPPNDPDGLVPSAQQLAQLPAGILPTQQGQGGIVIRKAPPAAPPGPGGIVVNPPGAGPPWTPLPVSVTYEVYGMIRRRKVPYLQVVSFAGGAYHVKYGDSLLVTDSAQSGFGFAGRPGRWDEVAQGRSPTNYGLDADKGVVAYNGSRAFPLPGYELMQLFGPNWRTQFY